MFARANRDYEASGPPPPRNNALASALFPSSSPTPANGDIRAMNSATKRRNGPPAFLPSSSPMSVSKPQFKRFESKSTSTSTSKSSGSGGGSLASLYKNNQTSFDHAPSAFVDLTDSAGAPNAKYKEAFDFDFDAFSDDDGLDLDYELPKAMPPAPPRRAVEKENMPPPASTPAKAIEWSSSPATHFLPPKQFQSMTSTAPSQGSPLKRESSGESIVEEAPMQQKPKKRKLPSSFKTEAKAEANDDIEIIGERLVGRTAKAAVVTETPNSKARSGFFDQTASAIKEQKRQLKRAQSNAAKAEAEEDEVVTSKQPEAISLSAEQQHVLKLVVEQGKSVFFTGPAGTGKSVLMRAIIAELKKKHVRDPDRVAVTASTGLAACNIGGITLHSFSGIGLGKEPAQALVKKVRRNPKAKTRWMRTKCLIIDEISMVDGQLFDKLSQIGRTIRNNGRPWGGIQLIITGDFLQLPPVPDGEQRESVFAFDASTWQTSIDHTIGLTQVFRQRDPEFANMLNEMRLGRISDKTEKAFQALSRPLAFNDGIESAQLFPTRNQVEMSNDRRMRELPGAPFKFDALDSGDPAVRDKLLVNMMAPKSIVLKVGAQVMLIKNLDDTLVNGSLGTVIDFTDQKTLEQDMAAEADSSSNIGRAKKKLGAFMADEAPSSNKYPLVKFVAANGASRVILCIPEEWKVELPNGDIQAKRVQVPLILAWSLSIHKAQGQTLDRVTVDLGRVFEKGQAYVALSRATTQDGLRVLGFRRDKVMAHPKVVDFYKKLYSAEEAAEMKPASIKDFIARRKGA